MRRDAMMGAAGAVLALVVVALLGASTALPDSRHGGCGGPGGPGARLDRLEAKLAALSLDDATRASVEQVIAQARADGEARRGKARDAHRAMRELLAQESPALERVMGQADAIGALETESQKAHLRTMLDLRSLLGPERWQQLRDSLREERAERMEKS